MMATAAPPLPPQVARLLAEFCEAGKSGSIQLDVKNGRIVSFKFTETGYVDKTR